MMKQTVIYYDVFHKYIKEWIIDGFSFYVWICCNKKHNKTKSADNVDKSVKDTKNKDILRFAKSDVYFSLYTQ